MNIDYVIHRYGEWTMLVLGESVLSLLIVDVPMEKDYFLIFTFGVLTVIMLQLLDFQSQAHDPNDHAMRRHKNAGYLFNVVMSMYSAALLAVGASYKILLHSLEDIDEDKGRRLFSFPYPFDDQQHRWLAEIDLACGPNSIERKQNVAHLFSVAMSVVFFSLDALILTHVGLKKGVDKCKVEENLCDQTVATKWRYNFKGLVFVVLPRIAITAVIVTLSQYVVDPGILALVGFGAVFCQIADRYIGDIFFNHRVDGHSSGGHRHHHHAGLSDDDESFDEGEEEISDDEASTK